MRQLARRAQGRLIDILEQRLGWTVVSSEVHEDENYDGDRVLELRITAEYVLDNGQESEYKHN